MADAQLLSGIYGAPPPHLAEVRADARQLSPLSPGASDLGLANPGSYSSIVMLAPPGTLERRHAMAEALNALAPGAEFIAIAPKDKGGARLCKELQAFGCAVAETSKSHHRICVARRPDILIDLDEALSAGAPRFVDDDRALVATGRVQLGSDRSRQRPARLAPAAAQRRRRGPRLRHRLSFAACAAIGFASNTWTSSRSTAAQSKPRGAM